MHVIFKALIVRRFFSSGLQYSGPFSCFCNNFLWFNMFLGCNVLYNRAFRFGPGVLACITSEFTRHHSKTLSFQPFEIIILFVIKYKKNMTFIYPRQCYSTSASGAEQTAEIKNPNWPETNQLVLPSTHIWIGCGADISLFFSWICLHFALSWNCRFRWSSQSCSCLCGDPQRIWMTFFTSCDTRLWIFIKKLPLT